MNYYHCAEFEHGFCSRNIQLYHETLFSNNCDTTGPGVVSKHCRLQMQPPGGAWWSHMQPVANATTRVHGTAWWLHMQPWAYDMVAYATTRQPIDTSNL